MPQPVPARDVRPSFVANAAPLSLPSLWDRLIVVANRAPVRHDRTTQGSVRGSRCSGDMVNVLKPLAKNCRGVWIAHSAGDADIQTSSLAGVSDGGCRLRLVALDDAVYHGYYYGFATEGLWPLCHNAGVAPVFRPDDFRSYELANAQFADAAAREVDGSRSLVLVQDYHLALVPRLIRHRHPHQAITAFWHIPWPRPRIFARCPWSAALLDGLLGSDLIGFQTEDDCRNFLACAEALPGTTVDSAGGRVLYRGIVTLVRVYPVGIDRHNDAWMSAPPPEVCRDAVRQELGLPADVRLAVGVDRLDYTKGINEKFLAVEQLLDQQPDLRGRFVLVQVAEPSHECLPAYQAARATLIATAARVNDRYGTDEYTPILLLERRHEAAEICRLYRAADLCYVGSLHDGMNLVAKEFVETRRDDRGVLLLSEFAGAARQLRGALLIDPGNPEKCARTLVQALEMTPGEQAIRMRTLRANVALFDSAWWGTRLMRDTADHCRDRRRESSELISYAP